MAKNQNLQQELIDLQKILYHRELSLELDKIYTEFNEWQAGNLSAEDLNKLLYQYQKGPAKELFLKYERPSFADINVAEAIISGVMDKSEVSQELLPIIESKIKVLSRI